MCEKAADACLLPLKFVPDWFITPKMLHDLGNTVFCNDNIDLDNDNPDNVAFSNDVICLVNLSLQKKFTIFVNFKFSKKLRYSVIFQAAVFRHFQRATSHGYRNP